MYHINNNRLGPSKVGQYCTPITRKVGHYCMPVNMYVVDRRAILTRHRHLVCPRDNLIYFMNNKKLWTQRADQYWTPITPKVDQNRTPINTLGKADVCSDWIFKACLPWEATGICKYQ